MLKILFGFTLAVMMAGFVDSADAQKAKSVKPACEDFCTVSCNKRVAAGTAVAGFGRCLQTCTRNQRRTREKCD
jgi:hypothetical protein